MKLLLVPVLLAVCVGAQPLTDEQMKKAEGFALGCLAQHKSLNQEHLVLLEVFPALLPAAGQLHGCVRQAAE
uniref:Uncharacterized protein n=1 Tax=Anopheles funestus TaxID=62324 RepID=A0A4Y0BNY6_ANOFN